MDAEQLVIGMFISNMPCKICFIAERCMAIRAFQRLSIVDIFYMLGQTFSARCAKGTTRMRTAI